MHEHQQHNFGKPSKDVFLNLLFEVLLLIIKNLPDMGKEIDDLQQTVADETTVQQSAIALLQGLHDRLVAAGTDKAALTKITNDLKSSKQALADAVTANTVAEDETGGTGTGTDTGAGGDTGAGDTGAGDTGTGNTGGVDPVTGLPL
jgi:hypothetical protein